MDPMAAFWSDFLKRARCTFLGFIGFRFLRGLDEPFGLLRIVLLAFVRHGRGYITAAPRSLSPVFLTRQLFRR